MIIVAHLARSLPRKVLYEMMLTGEAMSATEGHRLGFVNRLAETREDLETLKELGVRYGQGFLWGQPA